MSKKYESPSIVKLIQTIDKNVNKHGEIKVKGDKGATKSLKASCPHRSTNKKGKIKSALYGDGETGVVTCKLCGESFKTSPYDKEEIKTIVGKFNNTVNQAVYIGQELHIKESELRSLIELKVMATKFRKQYNNIAAAAVKNEQAHKGKGHKGGNGQFNNSRLNAWNCN